MDIKELRIGNYVTDEFYDSFKTIIKVESINDNGINLTVVDDGNWSELAQRWIEPDSLSCKIFGIPLTEEMLLNAGFIKNEALLINSFTKSIAWFLGDYKVLSINIENGNQYVYIREGVKSKPREDDSIICLFNGDKHGKIYLHYLQNLWKTLTQFELEISWT